MAPLRIEAADQTVLIFIRASFKIRIGVAVVDLSPLSLCFYTFLHACDIRKFGAVIDRDRAEDSMKKRCPEFTLDRVQRFHNARRRLVLHFATNSHRVFRSVKTRSVSFSFFAPSTLSISQCPKTWRVFTSAGRFSMLVPRGGFAERLALFFLRLFFLIGRSLFEIESKPRVKRVVCTGPSRAKCLQSLKAHWKSSPTANTFQAAAKAAVFLCLGILRSSAIF